MNIAMIGHKDFPSRSGGVEVVVYELAVRLAGLGHQVAVYNRGRKKGENHIRIQGVEVFRCAAPRRSGVNAMVASVTATLMALPRRYDVIHYHALGPSVLLLLPRLLGVPTVATVHGLDWQRDKWSRAAAAYLRLGERIIARFADEVIVLSPAAQEYFRRTYGRETHLIENAVAPVEPAPCKEAARRFGLEPGGYVLFLARMVPEKGLHLLIRAFRRCSTSKKLVIAGQVPDDPYGRQIQELARGCENILFTGFVEGTMLRELYSNCALYVLPSRVEGMALTLLEAMSAGARCLTSDIPENRDVLGNFGDVFQSGSEQALYEKLSWALEQPWQNPRAEEQRNYILERCRYDRMVERTLAVYEKAVRRGRS